MSEETSTMDDLATEEARLADLRERLGKEREKEQEMREAMDAAWDGDGDPDALSQAVSAAEVRVSTLQTKVEQQETRVEEVRAAALKGAAADRLVGIGRAHGSVRASYAEDVERIKAKAGELAEAVERFNQRFETLRGLEIETLCLLDRWPDLDSPKITRVLAPVTHEPAVEALKRGSGLALSRPERIPRRLVDVDARTARRLRQRIAGTPTAEILDAGGGYDEDHDERHRKAMEESRERGDVRRRREVEAVDEWLREALGKGPVPRDRVIEEAREKEIPVSGPGEATLSEARRRLDVRTLNPVVEVSAGSHIGSRRTRSVDTGTDFWALPKGWDEEAFQEFVYSRRSASAVRA